MPTTRPTFDMDKEMALAREEMKRGSRFQLFLLILIILVPILSVFAGTGESAFDWREDRLVLTYPDRTSVELAYAGVTGMEYRETFDFGSPVTGGIAERYRYGLWENEELGQYQLCCREDVAGCILLTVSGGRFALSFESEEATASLYSSLQETLREKGNLAQ